MTEQNVYPSHGPDEAAKKLSKEPWFVIPQPENSKDQKKKKYHVLKHSEKGLLAEAIIIGKKPKFAISRVNGDNEVRITLEDSIDNENETFLPLQDPMSRIFSFKSENEFDQYIEKVKNETLDSLYKKVKAIWRKYIDADDFHISLCAADTIFTYYQDRIGLTHYLFFVGDGDTGKSNNLTVIEYVGYRVFKSIGITSANIYTFLGNREEGQGTICEDEADNIDRNHEKMIYKSGYQIGSGVARTDLPQGTRSQNKWNTFSFKAFAGERLPDVVKAKGLNQRIIPLYCSDGDPDYDLAEVVSADGEEELQPLLDELNETHNLLFAYRLLHYHDVIPNIRLNIKNREKQLFKPILRVFQGTDKTFDELLPIVSHFVNRRRESNADSYHAFLYTTISELIKKQNSYELTIGLIWQTIKDSLDGNEISSKPLSYDSSEYGTISQKATSETLRQVFGGKPPKRRGKIRKLLFDKNRLARLERKYNLSTDIRITNQDAADAAVVGLYAHLPPDNEDKEIAKNKPENMDILHNSHRNDRENKSENQKETPTYPIDPRHPSHPRHEETDSNNNIYRLGHSDRFACQKCKMRGDIHEMKVHACNGKSKKKKSS